MAAPAAYSRRTFTGNAAATTVPLGLGAADGSCTIASATNWPSGSGGNFLVVIDRGQNTEELAWSSGVSGTTLTFSLRGAQGTTGVSHGAGCTIALSMGQQDLDEANQVTAAVLGQSGAAKGDILYMLSAAGPNTLARLAAGTLNQFFRQGASSVPKYADLFIDTPVVASATAAAYQMVRFSGSTASQTITSPGKQAGSFFGVFNGGSVSITVAAATGNIVGSGIAASTTSIKLAPNGSAIFYDDGTNYEVVAGQQDTGRTTPSFVNSWSGFTYRLQGNIASIEGPASGGTSGTTATTLPASLWPPVSHAFACAQTGGTAGNDITVTVANNGVVQIFYPAGISQAYVDGCTWTVD